MEAIQINSVRLVEDCLPERSGNFICKIEVDSTKEYMQDDTWMVLRFYPETQSWEKNKTVTAWTEYPPVFGDTRFL